MGERIRQRVRAGNEPLEDDLAVVEAFRLERLADVVLVQELLDGLAESLRRAHPEVAVLVAAADEGRIGSDEFLRVASRPKTTASIVAKLTREHTRLTQMQDIVGGRIVVPTPQVQEIVQGALVVAHRNSTGTQPRVTDTRERGDDHGYRAIHVVLHLPRPVEIQIRTMLQQAWAQLVEATDERHATDLKHGTGPAEWLAWFRSLSASLRLTELGEDVELPLPPRSLLEAGLT